MQAFLTVKNGKIEIHADIGAFDAPAAFVASTAAEAAQYLRTNNIDEWMNSSSMDFAMDDGWHRNDACTEIEEELAKL